MTNQKLIIGWLYPILMSTYGDRGNIIVLQKIGEAAGLDIEIKLIDHTSEPKSLSSCDILFMGGAQDRQQEIVIDDLLSKKGKELVRLLDDDVPGLFICGAYQFLGNYYKDSYGTKIKGLGVFDMYTESFSDLPRLIGNISIKPISTTLKTQFSNTFIGFENHGGRTFLKDKGQAFAKVVKGFGNNGKDGTEGIIFKNAIGTYLHGPILPSNPELAVHLLKASYQKKYGMDLTINFDTTTSNKAREMMLKRI